MKPADAIRLIRGAVPREDGVWADLGCGDGTFTLALADLLGPASRIYAVDSDPGAISLLRRRVGTRSTIIPVVADFTGALSLPGHEGMLDGILLANSLHYVPDPAGVLRQLALGLRPGGRAVFVEYDRRAASRWVPYPIPSDRLESLTTSAGLSAPKIVATRPSVFAGTLYAAIAWRAPLAM